MIYALYISCIFAPFSASHSLQKNPFWGACVLQDCSHERFDSGSHYRLEQFSQHKIEKRAALRNKPPPPEPKWPLISSENTLAAKDFDFEGRGRDLLLFFMLTAVCKANIR